MPTLPSRLDAESSPEAIAAVAALVAADDAAGFGYAPYAAAMAGEDRARAVSLLNLHSQRSLAVRTLADAAGFDLPPPPAAYQVPPTTDPPQACAELEAACARAGADLIGRGDADARRLGRAVLLQAGVAQSAWAGIVALPGLS